MKKQGFTLAEVLITLGIIGVISALTLPSLTGNVSEQTIATQLKSNISNIENAFMNAITQEDVGTISDTTFGTRADSATKFAGNLGRYLPNDGGSTASLTDYRGLNGGTMSMPAVDYKIDLKNGATMYVSQFAACEIPSGADLDAAADRGTTLAGANSVAGRMVIDVNGIKKKPNRFGRDTFAYAIGYDGRLYGYGTRALSVASIQKMNGTSAMCADGNNSIYCTGKFIEEGYKYNYSSSSGSGS